MKSRNRYIRSICGLNLICTLFIFCGRANAADAFITNDTIFDVPRADAFSINHPPADWEGKALDVRMFCCAKGMPWPKATNAPSMYVAWNNQGLLAEVKVHHAHPWEYDYVRHLFKGDSIEFFVSPHVGSRDRYMLIISPGLDPRYPEPRHCFFPDPSEAAERDVSDLTFDCDRIRSSDGYTLRVLLPWSNLHIEPRLGMELALQVYVMEAEPNAPPVVAMWNPIGESFVDPRSTQRIRLEQIPSPPVVACATAQDDTEQKVRMVRIVAPLTEAGKQFQMQAEGAGVAYGSMAKDKTQSFATLSLPVGQSCQIVLNGLNVPVVVLPPQNDLATVLTQNLKCKFERSVFQGEKFPSCYVEGARHFRMAGVTFYNDQYQIVTQADRPGRYGAVVKIADAKGVINRRFRTLFRIPDALGSWHAASDTLDALPAILASDPAVSLLIAINAAGHRDLSFLRQEGVLADPDTSALAACFAEKQQSPSSDNGLIDFRSKDRQWWVGLKRKLNGWDQQFPKPFVYPLPIAGETAPMVHGGSLVEAGVRADKLAELDSTYAQSVARAGEPVSICLVRHGVIFFHRAYGNVDGRPFTIDDTGDFMSATKPLGGALMMEVIDSGAVDVDEPVDKIFPSFRHVPVKRAMTIRDLYDHLNGLSGDWGDQIHDTEEIVAGYYPAVDVGNYSYNELGFALGGKIIEAVTGEGFPQFARRHLLAPLGMDHTRVTNSGGHNATTSLDYAKFGQMLLNRGSYGNMCFFSESTFKQMLPSTDGSNRRGMGLVWLHWERYGFGSDTFGHLAGNSSLLAVDPTHDLVVVIISGGARKDFAGQADVFYRAVIAALK